MDIDQLLEAEIREILSNTFGISDTSVDVALQNTRRDFKGDRTLVVFPYLRFSKKSPEDTAKVIGEALVKSMEVVSGYNVIKGFLNIELSTSFWVDFLLNGTIGYTGKQEGTVLVEYSSPNTNKPLHLGHIRNNLLGYSVSRIIEANGKKAVKVQVINDRGIHICKSMVAWKNYGEGVTPEIAEKKGDHLVGDFYVKYNDVYKEQVEGLIASGVEKEKAEKEAPILQEAQEMLRKWEDNDPEVRALWEKMNSWVYKGFDQTYKDLGVDFDKLYYESSTYLKGKEIVLEGLEKGIFYRKDDSSVWADMEGQGLDKKVLIRADGTSVYMTQDIGTAVQRYEDYPDMTKMIYTVGNEQNYHFKVLFILLEILGYPWAQACEHLSYGMVELPSGKMKSREGTVVDADDLISEMIQTAQRKSEELGKLEGMSEAEKAELYRIIGLGALKYFILKVDPKKQIVFNPEESIEFIGNTGPFIQYTHARIRTLLDKADGTQLNYSDKIEISDLERDTVKQLYLFGDVIQTAMKGLSPADVANYTYDLVKLYNQFYQTVPILKEENAELKAFRLDLSQKVADTVKEAMSLLGIEVPERM